MPLFRRLLACLVLGLRVASELPAAGIEVPPITGELSGEFRPLILPDAPALTWKLALRPGAAAKERAGDFSIEGPGLKLKGEAHLTTARDGTWRLTEGSLDLGTWFTWIAAKYIPSLVSAEVRGTLALTGEGALRDGQLTGRVTFALHDGSLQDVLQGWSIEGMELSGTLGPLPALVSEGPVTLAFREATVKGVTARNALLELRLGAEETVQVTQATAGMFQGTVSVSPFSFPLLKPAFAGSVQFTSIEIAELKDLLPPVLDRASGKVSGRMGLSFNPEDGLVPGTGRLQIDPGGAAALRLAPQPGFLTSHMPERLTLLPDWLGPLQKSKLFSPVNPAYETLRAIEMGEVDLEVNALDVGMQPEGDPEGRTASVVITARPLAKESVVESVRFQINVKGPLADVLRMGLEGKVQVRAH